MLICVVLVSFFLSLGECNFIPKSLLANNTPAVSALCLCKSLSNCQVPNLYEGHDPKKKATRGASVLTKVGIMAKNLSFNHHVLIEEIKVGKCVESNKRCSGILISDRWILTSVTCLLELKKVMEVKSTKGSRNHQELLGMVRAVSSDSGFFIIGQTFAGHVAALAIDLIVQHPRYRANHTYNGFDIALLRLQQSALMAVPWRVQPVCLPFVQQHHAVYRWLLKQPHDGYVSTLYAFGERFMAARISINFPICSERDIMNNELRCIFEYPEAMRHDWGVPLTLFLPKYDRQILIGTGSDVLKPKEPKRWILALSNVGRFVKWIILTIVKHTPLPEIPFDLNAER